MIGTVLEGTIEGKPVLIVAVFNSPPNGKALVIQASDQKMKVVDVGTITVLWHYDEKDGWVPDFPDHG